MKKVLYLIPFLFTMAFGQITAAGINVNIIGYPAQDSLDSKVWRADTNWYKSSITKTGFMSYVDFIGYKKLIADSTNWNTAYTRSGLFAADSTAWNLAATRAALLVVDTTDNNTAFTRAALLVIDTTDNNTAFTRAALLVLDTAEVIDDTTNFAGAAVRLAYPKTGVTGKTRVQVSARNVEIVNTSEVYPLQTDAYLTYCKPDTIVVLRSAGGASGQKIHLFGKIR